MYNYNQLHIIYYNIITTYSRANLDLNPTVHRAHHAHHGMVSPPSISRFLCVEPLEPPLRGSPGIAVVCTPDMPPP